MIANQTFRLKPGGIGPFAASLAAIKSASVGSAIVVSYQYEPDEYQAPSYLYGYNVAGFHGVILSAERGGAAAHNRPAASGLAHQFKPDRLLGL